MGIWKYEKKYKNQREINKNITKGFSLLEKLISGNKNLVEHDTKLIEHHTKYLEIDGEDKTVFITRNEHAKIHKEYKFRIPREISRKAYERTEKRKKNNKNRVRNRQGCKKNQTNELQNVIRQLANIEKCPFCENGNIMKGGKTTGTDKQRYICKNCNKYFTVGLAYNI